jgi:hypothetical protein
MRAFTAAAWSRGIRRRSGCNVQAKGHVVAMEQIRRRFGNADRTDNTIPVTKNAEPTPILIAARIKYQRTRLIAMGGAIGAGEIAHPIGHVDLGIEQARGRTAIAERTRPPAFVKSKRRSQRGQKSAERRGTKPLTARDRQAAR